MNQTLCMKIASSDIPSISLRKRKSRLKIRFLSYYEDKTLILTTQRHPETSIIINAKNLNNPVVMKSN